MLIFKLDQIKHELFPIGSFEYDMMLFEFSVWFSGPTKTVSDTLTFTGKSNLQALRVEESSENADQQP